MFGGDSHISVHLCQAMRHLANDEMPLKEIAFILERPLETVRHHTAYDCDHPDTHPPTQLASPPSPDDLHRWRAEANYSLSEVATRLSVTKNTVSNWERGKAVPSYESLVGLYDLYEVSPTPERYAADYSADIYTDGGTDTLHASAEGLTLPEPYAETTDGVVIRTRTATIHLLPGAAFGSPTPIVCARHFPASGHTDREVVNGRLADDEVSLKRHGETAETYSVAVDRLTPTLDADEVW